MTASRKNMAGFTIFELMVVVGIIVLLMAILIPSLAAARKRGYITSTTSLMANLQGDIDTYYTTFNAYPGPAPASVTTGATGTKVSGAQNLLAGLTYSVDATASTTTVQFLPPISPLPPNPAVTGLADPTSPTGPTDCGTLNPDNTYKKYSPFYSPAAKDLSVAKNVGSTPLAWYPGGVNGASGADVAFPVILDHFPDALPILYYRKIPGVDGTGSYPSSSAPNINNPGTIVSNVSFGSGTASSYYYNENMEYTNSGVTLVSPVGTSWMQNGSLYSATVGGTTVYPMAKMVSSQSNTTATARGGYVLISAGPLRVYGIATGSVTTDNIVIVGGN